MKSSRPQSSTGVPNSSLANSEQSFTGNPQQKLFNAGKELLPGELNDALVIRGVLTDSIKHCAKSRAQIAEEMTYLVGREVTERMLNAYTAESKEDHRWPSELTRAFCAVTGDNRLLRCVVERAGLYVISDEDAALLELGRQYFQKLRATESIASIEQRLRIGGIL